MSAPSTVLFHSLQSITTTKTRELRKQRRLFETRKAKILEAADKAQGERSRLRILLSGLDKLDSSKELFGNNDSSDSELRNIRRYLSQSRYDPSISSELLQEFEEILRARLSQQSLRYDFADLYSRLLIEWSDQSGEVIAETSETASLDGSFQLVERDRLQQLREKFASVVFSPRVTNEVEIDNYLDCLFSDDKAQAALLGLREDIQAFGERLLSTRAPFNLSVLGWCIKGLLRNDLMNDEQKATLNDFLANDVVLGEIADVLNMHYSDLENWSWESENGLYYEPRRQINGKYRIMMDQDILQAIFHHYIGVTWAIEFKEVFKKMATSTTVWKRLSTMSREEEYRHLYFCNDKPNILNGMSKLVDEAYEKDYFMTSMPSTVEEGAGNYNDDDQKESSGKSALDIRQQLLRQLATEIIIQRSLYNEVAIVQSDLQWFASGLPHTTIFALLRFWGVPETWISFFKKFAEAPLRMSEAPRAEVRIRKRGIPITDAFEKLLGEIILFAMDVAVNRDSGMTMYRLHDDLWLCGSPAACATAWGSIERFVKTLGLEINFNKTGSVYLSDKTAPDSKIKQKLPKGAVSVGLLKLDESGRWIIHQSQVDAHVKQIQKQLAACTSVFSWVQTWNSCIGRFFQYSFGQPANCFGRDHVNSILETHKKMQDELFPGGSVASYLRSLIADRLGVKDVPDCFFFMPEELGGLGLRNPFIPFLVIREQLLNDPAERMLQFKESEAKAYKEAKDAFEALSEHDKRRHFKTVYDEDYARAPAELEHFMSFKEYTRHRERYSYLLRMAYMDLMRLPGRDDIHITGRVLAALRSLSVDQPDMMLHRLDSERKWIVQLYSEDLYKQFGGLSIVDKGLLPLGVMTMLRKKKVTWEMVL